MMGTAWVEPSSEPDRYFLGIYGTQRYVVPVARRDDWEAWLEGHDVRLPHYVMDADDGNLTFEKPQMCYGLPG